ncbi:reverse transcriptase-like protein [Bacillus sp. BGMRC 2118]|nr:reverse transcriptase-like protein [Bacillus sp. BGMRC 2118]
MKVWIEWTYKTPKNLVTTLTSEFMPAKQALLVANDFLKTGRTKDVVFYDEQHTKWTKKEFEKLLEQIVEEPHDIVVFFDGGYDIETKQAGVGVVIYYTRNNQNFRIRENIFLDQLDSNNEAEYAAIWQAVLRLEELGVQNIPVQFKGDSQVVLNQLSGEWPCFEDEFTIWLDRIEEKVQQLGIRPTYTPITRKENKEADQLATQALQGTMVSSHLNLSE